MCIGKFFPSSSHPKTHPSIPPVPFFRSPLTVLAQYLGSIFTGKFFHPLTNSNFTCQFHPHSHNLHPIPKLYFFLSFFLQETPLTLPNLGDIANSIVQRTVQVRGETGGINGHLTAPGRMDETCTQFARTAAAVLPEQQHRLE